MRSVLRSVRKRKKSRRLGKVDIIRREEYAGFDVDAKVEMIRALVPLGLMHVQELLDDEVTELAGARHARKESLVRGRRHGSNPGTVRLAGQRVPLRVPRVRSVAGGEIPLRSYEAAREDSQVNDVLLKRVLYGISCRNYEAAAESVPGAIGLSSSTVSRNFIQASAATLREFQERDLSGEDVVALFLDGKAFADSTMVIALGITISGKKRFLGFVETDTETAQILAPFLRSLVDRGLDASQGLLVILDGGKGLRSAVKKVFRDTALVHRCQWHKRENVVSYLPKSEQGDWRRRLQRAYNRPTYPEALAALEQLHGELDDRNQSAAGSLVEGLDETLTLHRLGVSAVLGRSFKTTNCLESVNALVEERCAKVDQWTNSSQRQRWLATALVDIEPRLRKVVGYRHLPKLREALQRELKIERKTPNNEGSVMIRSRGEFQLRMGLTPCVDRNRVFPTEHFQDDLHFVFLNQSLERLQRNTGGQLPSATIFVEDTDDYHDILWDLSFLASIHRQMRAHPEQLVRAKHLATYDLYRRRYPDLLAAFEASGFQPECICPTHDWSRDKAHFREETTDI